MNNKNQKIKSIISLILAVCVVSGIAPTISWKQQCLHIGCRNIRNQEIQR